VAHDFNNLLTTIHGYAELSRDGLESDDPRLADLDEILRAVDRGAELTGQLLAFSRRQPASPDRVDLNALIAGRTLLLRRTLGEQVQLELQPAGGLWSVSADPGQLEQVLVNLALNARDALREGGRIRIETENVYLTRGQAREQGDVSPGPYAVLRVSDDGVGMDARTRERAFEPFFTTKEPGAASGLGLAAVHGIVEEARGHVRIRSSPGSGTTVEVYLPALERPAAAPLRALGGEPARGSETVLLVEDDDLVRQLAARTLRYAGYTVLEAESPESALERAAEHSGPIDVLLTDIVMPGMSGLQLAKRIGELHAETRAIYMTGYAGDQVARQEGDPPILQKPFALDALLRSVRERLSK
jgi:CheY-like chemotaxis protein